MATAIRDWHLHGVTLKVELATSGSLVVGGNQTSIDLVAGGEYGAPSGWDAGEYYQGNPQQGNEAAYNWTTQTGIFSVSPKAATGWFAGVWQLPANKFPLVPGRRYQVGCQARQMAGKEVSQRLVAIQQSPDGVTWPGSLYASTSGAALTDWEDILLTGPAVAAQYNWGRVMLIGGPYSGANLWGTQFQKLYVNALDAAPPPITWMDITCDTQGVAFRYGRERFTNRYDVGSLQVQLVNMDGKYAFSANHPFGLRPGRQVRVTATYQGVEYPMAYGVLDSIQNDYSISGQVIATLQCVDPTSVMSNAATKTTGSPWVYSGGRVNLLLDSVGYVPRQIDPGVMFTQAIIASGTSVRDEAGLTADSEGGNFFADREGRCVYKDRTWPNVDDNLKSVTADLVAFPHYGIMPIVDDIPTQAGAPIVCVDEYETDWSLDRVVNIVSLANAGGVAREYRDEDSLKAYGPATYQRHDFVLRYDNDLDTRAADIMTGYSESVLRVKTIKFAPGKVGAWPWVLKSFLNWLVRIWYQHPTNFWGYATTVHVQSVEHTISLHDWTTTLTVDRPRSFTELELLEHNGWDDAIWDENLWDQGAETHGAVWTDGYTWNGAQSKWGE